MDEPTPEHWQRVVDNTGLVWFHLHRCRMSEDERAEAYGDGCLGLLRAAQKFDPDLGYTFATYAMYWIRQAVGRGFAMRSTVNARYAAAKGEKYRPPVSLDFEILGPEGTATLADYLEDTGPGAEQTSLAAVRLAVVYAAMRAAAKDDFDLAIIAGVSEEYGWQARVAEREGKTREAVRRRWARLRQVALAADSDRGFVRGRFEPDEVRREMLDDPTLADPFEAPCLADQRAKRAAAKEARRADTAAV